MLHVQEGRVALVERQKHQKGLERGWRVPAHQQLAALRSRSATGCVARIAVQYHT